MCNVWSLGRMLHLQGSSLAIDFVVLLRRLFTSEVHTRIDDHAAQSYTSASFNSTSNLCHCKKFAIASLVKLGHCTGCFHLPTPSTFAKVLSFQICTLHSFAHVPIVLRFHQTGYDSNPFGDAVFITMLKLLLVELVFLTAITGQYACTRDGTPSSIFGVLTISFSFLAVARLQNQLVMMPDFRGTARPKIALRHFVRGLDRWTVASEVADCVYDLIVGRSTGRTIIVKRRNERHTETETPIVRQMGNRKLLQCTMYCNEEYSHQITCSLYTGGNLVDTGSLELPQWNPPASWSLL